MRVGWASIGRLSRLTGRLTRTHCVVHYDGPVDLVQDVILMRPQADVDRLEAHPDAKLALDAIPREGLIGGRHVGRVADVPGGAEE